MEKFNELQVMAWKVIEYLVEHHFDPASATEIAEGVKIGYMRARRILFTWERLGLIERVGEGSAQRWRITKYLSLELPGKLRKNMEKARKEIDRGPSVFT